MTVFRTFLKIAKQNIALIALYLVLFLGITMALQMATTDVYHGDYKVQSIKIGVVNEDHGPLAASLISYLESFHSVTLLDNEEIWLAENLFYRNVEYIVKIPADFEARCISGSEKLPVIELPESYSGIYAEEQINSFLSMARTYADAGLNAQETASLLANLESPVPQITYTEGSIGKTPVHSYYFQYIPYLFLFVFCYALGIILSTMNSGNLPMRMAAAPLSPKRLILEGLLASGILGIAIWILVIALALLQFGNALLYSEGFLYYILNSFAMLLVSLSLSYLIASLTVKQETLNSVAHTLSLGMSLLCGVFVPLELMNQEVKEVAQFLPVYWYETANTLLSKYSTITAELQKELLSSIGIQFVFAAAFFCLTLALYKKVQY